MQQQLATEEPLTSDEADHLIVIDTGRDDAQQQLLNAVNALHFP
jgi:hypothetical protein